jgi:hypothetical protein
MKQVLTNREDLIETLKMIDGNRVEGLPKFVAVLISDIEIANGEPVDYTRALTCLSFGE